MSEKEVFNLYDDDCEGKIDALYVGTVCRALGLKPTNEMVWKACGKEFKKKGEKKFTFEEFMPVYEALKKQKVQGSFNDYLEGLKVFDKEETGKIMAAEVRHALMSLGERLTAAEIDEVLEGVPDADNMVDYAAFIKKCMAGPFPEG
jgi:Ca2+-binding EF-hand superfamily protein